MLAHCELMMMGCIIDIILLVVVLNLLISRFLSFPIYNPLSFHGFMVTRQLIVLDMYVLLSNFLFQRKPIRYFLPMKLFNCVYTIE